MKIRVGNILFALLGLEISTAALGSDYHQNNQMNNFYFNIFENDILATPRSGKHGLSSPVPQTLLWPEGKVYYKFEAGHYLPEEKKVIQDTMKYLETIANVKFIEGKGPDNYFVKIVKHDKDGKQYWCTAHVGKAKVSASSDWKQLLTLGSACIDRAVIIHELLHVLGMHHEQTRQDRDEVISLLNENYHNGKLHENRNYRKYDNVSTTSITSYDFDSIMHYHAYGGSKNSLPVLLPSKCYNHYRQEPGKYEFYNIENLKSCEELKKMSVWKKDLSENDKLSLVHLYGSAKSLISNGNEEALRACWQESKASSWFSSIDDKNKVHTYYLYKPRDHESCFLVHFNYVLSSGGQWVKTKVEEEIIYKQN